MNDAPASHAAFPPTHWTLIAAASGPDNDGALGRLYQTYWHPLCAQARRFGVGAEDVEDVVQELFIAFIASDSLAHASAARGRFRSYLLGTLRNFLNHRRARLGSQKRGGGETPLPLDAAENVAGAQPGTHEFDADWARALIGEAMRRFTAEQDATAENRASFAVLGELALGDAPGPPEAAAARLGVTVPAVKSRIFRLRERLREIVREEVMRTVTSDTACDEELRYLGAVLGKVNGVPHILGA